MRRQRLFYVALARFCVYAQKIEDIRVFQRRLSQLGLRIGQVPAEIADRLALTLHQAAFNLMHQHTARPAMRYGFTGAISFAPAFSA